MSDPDIESLLKDFFIFPDQFQSKHIEFLASENDHESLDACLRTDENWNLFFENNFDSAELKKKFDTFSEEERINFLKFGISCFLQFVNCNFTGPGAMKETEEYLGHEKFSKYPFGMMLSVNNEEINVNTEYPALLLTSKMIFEWCFVNQIVNNWWLWRAILIHQEIFDELSPALLSDADRIHKLIQLNSDLKGNCYFNLVII